MPQTSVVWLIFAEPLERIARLFSGNLCPSSIAGKALRESQQALISGLVDLRSKVDIEPVGLAAIEWPHRDFVQVSTG